MKLRLLGIRTSNFVRKSKKAGTEGSGIEDEVSESELVLDEKSGESDYYYSENDTEIEKENGSTNEHGTAEPENKENCEIEETVENTVNTVKTDVEHVVTDIAEQNKPMSVDDDSEPEAENKTTIPQWLGPEKPTDGQNFENWNKDRLKVLKVIKRRDFGTNQVEENKLWAELPENDRNNVKFNFNP